MKRRTARVVGIVIGALLVAAVAGIAIYRDGNLRAEARTIAKAIDAGFAEKTMVVDGATVNYAEGPDAGPALLLVHGQGMEWEDYASVLPTLAERYHVFAVDCFGHGESSHDASLYTCEAGGNALIAFARQAIGGEYIVSGHSSGGILAAYVAAHDTEHVTACVLEDPPLFRVTPEEAVEGAGTFAWHDGYTVAHAYVQEFGTSGQVGTEGDVGTGYDAVVPASEIVDVPYAVWYASHSYLFGLFGGLQPMIAEQTAAWCDAHPWSHAVNAWVPRAWTRGMYFMDDFDPRFGDTFYDGTWMEGIDQEAMLRAIECPVVYLKAKTRYGDDGVLYAATSDADAARIRDCLDACDYIEVDCGHDIHVELPDEFVRAVEVAAGRA